MTPQEIAFCYKKRWGIEVYFKFLKQNLNFSHFPSSALFASVFPLYLLLAFLLPLFFFTSFFFLIPKSSRQPLKSFFIIRPRP